MCLCFMCILHDALVKTKKLKEIEEREQNEVVNTQSRTNTLINLNFFDSASLNQMQIPVYLIAVQNSIQPSKEEEMRKIQKNQRLNNRWVQKMLVLIQCFF